MRSANIILNYPYKSHQIAWEKRAAVRSHGRKLIAIDDERHYYFPLSRQPLALHPVIEKMGEAARQFVLLQSCYKFMNDVAMIETEVVNAGALLIANNRLAYKFPKALQLDALTVIIDEAYHAYVAFDFLEQLIAKTGIEPLPLPVTGPVLTALKAMQNRLPEELRDLFTVIAICIGEHVLIKDLVAVSKGKTVMKAFADVMEEHVMDEGRHSQMFIQVMALLWRNLDEPTKAVLGPGLIDYFRLNFDNGVQREFEGQVLGALGLTAEESQQILQDLYPNTCDLSLDNPVIVNIVKMLERCGVFEHQATREAFRRQRLI